MSQSITIDARWIGDDGIWIATSADVPGLVIEGTTWTEMIGEVRHVLPELLRMDGRSDSAMLVVRAEAC